MKVVIKTGWKSKPTTHVDVSLRDDKCIDVTVISTLSLNPMTTDMNKVLESSYISIGIDFGFTNPELDIRDNQTVWIWDK